MVKVLGEKFSIKEKEIRSLGRRFKKTIVKTMNLFSAHKANVIVLQMIVLQAENIFELFLICVFYFLKRLPRVLMSLSCIIRRYKSLYSPDVSITKRSN